MDCRTKRAPRAPDDSGTKSGVNHLMDVLMKNYDIVTVLADFERPDTPTEHSVLSHRPLQSIHSLDTPPLRRAHDLNDPIIHANRIDDGTMLVLRQWQCCALPEMTNNSQSSDSWWGQISASFWELCSEVGQALSENCDEMRLSETDQTRFSAHALKRDIKRCLTASHGYLETGAALRDLQMWRSPLVTLSLFLVYFYSVFRGWLLSIFFFIILLQLSVNYLWTQKNVNLGLNFLPRKELPIPKLDISGAQLVFDIARRAQKLFKLTADVLEKLNSLFMWRRPDTTLKFYCIVLLFFLASSFLAGSTLVTIVMAALGGKTFITTYLFNRFPKLRKKFDIIVHFFDRLPVLSERQKLFLPPQNSSPVHSANSLTLCHGQVKKSRSTISIANTRPSAHQPQSFENSHASSESNLALLGNTLTYNGPSMEQREPSSIDDSDSVQSDCQDVEIQRECYMYDSERFFPVNSISGRLIVNDICVIFKSNKLDKADLYIQFQDIAFVKKPEPSKSLKFLSNSGKSLELYLKNRKKPYVFRGISKRDQLYQALQRVVNV